MHELAVPVISQRRGKWSPRRNGSQHPSGSPTGVYEANGGYIMLLVQQHEFSRLARAMGMPELATDERFSSNGRRVRNNAALKELIETWLKSFPDRDSAVAALDKERVPCGPVLSLEEAVDHPHLRERKTVRTATDPRLGKFDLPSMPVKFSDWPDRTDLKASLVGQDNEAILHEMLGLSDAQIAELYTAQILIKATPATEPAAASS
jgi:CoA:oxalate CoA-transferase